MANTTASDSSLLAAARAAERGRGGARDYARAAEIYTRVCDEGRGELAACVALLDAVESARGIAYRRDRVIELQTALCRRGDPVACAQNAWLAMYSRDVTGSVVLDRTEYETQEKRVADACAAGDGRACEWIGGRVHGHDSEAEQRRRRAYGTACAQGQLYACGQLASALQKCGDFDVEDVAACEARAIAWWRASGDDADRLDAVARIDAACRAGDATACDLVPSRRVSPEVLCRAHEYGACSELGCVGDDAAEAAARAHGVQADQLCARAYVRALAAWRLMPPGPERPRFPPVVADHREPKGARPSPPFLAVRFAFHGGRDRRDWPRFDVYNISDRAVTELGVCLYAYSKDPRGMTQLAGITVTLPSVDIAPNVIRPLALEDALTTALPPGTDAVLISYDQVRFAGDPAAHVDATRCPAHLPFDDSLETMYW